METVERRKVLPDVDYSQIVPMRQPFDPETEELLYSFQLKNGMAVLVERNARIDDIYPNDGDAENLRERNRWCVVTQIQHEQVMVGYKPQVRRVYFIGIYPDGTKTVRSYLPNTGWHVKKNTIPQD